MGLHCRRRHAACVGATVGGAGRSADRAAPGAAARRSESETSGPGAGGAADRRLASAPPRSRLGPPANEATPRGMARIEDRRVLSPRPGCTDRCGARVVDGERGGQLAGRIAGVGAPSARGGGAPAPWVGARGRAVDREGGSGSLARRDGGIGLLSREPTSMGIGAGGVSRRRSGRGGVGATALAPFAPWPRARGGGGNRGVEAPARRTRENRASRTTILWRPRGTDALPGDSPAGLADWQRGGGVGVSATAMSV